MENKLSGATLGFYIGIKIKSYDSGGMNKMNSKSKECRIKIAEDTMKIMSCGGYTNSKSVFIDIEGKLKNTVDNTILYKPIQFQYVNNILEDLKTRNDSKKGEIKITAETTLEATYRLTTENKLEKIACLNFASAKNPGGGFLTGSRAQEESIARSSGLYISISKMKEMYEYNKKHKAPFYSDYMIFSPEVPVFKNDEGSLLDAPYLTSIITSPAVNAGYAINKNDVSMIKDVMVERIKKILLVLVFNKIENIVLGAWGCGVFKNKSEDVAGYFREVLIEEEYRILFENIIFAIYDNSRNKSTMNAFVEKLC